ncbi:hypothetical protein ACFW2Y_21250 [Streptomyces sp. NPDC058877]|uniref:hypothetical protein n=1 Tax=unclassified Streptomyces TaxID=2593676 RepID=UPI0036BFBAB3
MERQSVLTGQSALAVAAAVSMAPALIIGLPTVLGGLFFLTALPVLLPLCLRWAPQTFAWVSLALGTGLLAWSVVGLVVGMFLFAPAAVLLLVAAFLDSHTRPGALGGLTAVGFPLAFMLMAYGIPGL